MAKFTHLHVHSHYSLLDGLAKIDDLLGRAQDLGFESLALTDHGVLYGLIEFYQKARRVGIKPILGCEVYVAYEGMRDKRPGIDDKRYHLTLLAEDYDGYKNLIQIVTRAHLEGFYYKPRVDKELLRKHAQGLIALSGCLNGEIPKAIIARRPERAEALIREYQEIFGPENFYLELGAHPQSPEQKIVNSALIELSAKTGAKVVGVNDVHYARSDEREAQDILVSVNTAARTEDENRLTMKADDFSMKSSQEMMEFFRDLPEAITNTQEISSRVNVEIPLGKILLPAFPLPPGFSTESYLEKLSSRGLEKRFGPEFLNRTDPEASRVRERLAYELTVIEKTGFAPYFLIVADCVNWARNQGIMVGPGRGSAAGSIVSWLLGITDVDPLKYNLLFERFLNPSRVAMPDIDLDFSDRRRDEVIEYVAKKYGRDHVAQIITFGTMAARAAIRDTGRALSMPYSFCDHLAKLIPFHMSLRQALGAVAEFKNLYQTDPNAKKLVDSAMKLEGVARHASTHACGVVITPEKLTEYVPLQLARPSSAEQNLGGLALRSGASATSGENDKVVVTQYEMHAIEDLGLLKMDFLGLRNLTIIEDAVRLIKERAGIDLDIDAIPLQDRETYRLFQEGKTSGVFQFESDGIKRYLKELKPTEFEDLVSMVSLYRPGPMELIPSFINRKHGREKITHLHPKLEPILKNTYGICVYQEQLMQMARDLGGFSMPEADTLRKAVGKKIKSLLEEQKEKFIGGMLKNDIGRKTAEEIWSVVPPFARYAFNRSHGVCYALIAYQTAYLKTHFPAEFMAALMSNEGFEVERVAFLVDEAKAMGLIVLPPSLNASNVTFTVASPKEIRFGLGSIKNVGTNIVGAIIAARERGGPFGSVEDFVERVTHRDLNKKSLEALIKGGAMDELGERAQLLKNLDKILEYSRNVERSKASGQVSLFSTAQELKRFSLPLESSPPASKKERLAWERELLGLYISEHPLDEYREKLGGVTPAADLAQMNSSRSVAVGGIVSGIERVITRAGSPMLFVKLEDSSGKTEILVFSSLIEKYSNLFQPEKVLIVKGRLSRDRDRPKVLADEVTEIA